MNLPLIVVAAVIGLPGLMATLHLTVLAVASLFYREPSPDGPIPSRRFLVLIPAHNEEDVLSHTLSAIHHAQRRGDQVLVIADRCTDQTAAIAEAFGVRVLARPPDARPGRAATRQDGVDFARHLHNWEVMVMIDADSVVEPGFFDVCERMLATGALALQVRSEAKPARGFFGQSGVAAFALQGILIPRGRDRLGLSVRLKGSGLVVVREVIERHRFRGPGASEDLWLSLDLCCEGIRPRHVDSARLRSETARSLRAASIQRLRWEAGRLLAARQFVRPLLRRHDAASLEAALHLITPPLAIAALSLVISASLLVVGGERGASPIPAALLVLIAFDVAVGLIQARAPAKTWWALLAAPAYIIWKAWLLVRAILQVLRRNPSFGPTPRD
jgi:cellulose synthase/poly-beta-1,6-N-acetylglucosamine synthase-like glycosyltransferase